MKKNKHKYIIITLIILFFAPIGFLKVHTAEAGAVQFIWDTVTGDNPFLTLASSAVVAILSAVQQLLSLVSSLLNSVIKFTITDFSTYFAQIQPSVDLVWTAFRDIANILMIGIFIYISFLVMLDASSFVSPEKLLVRVLLIAVLINFSLFFTKVIIDISNVTAIQFYTMLENELPENGRDAGVAGAIIHYTGISSVSGGKELVTKMKESNSNPDASFGGVLFVYFIYSLLLMVIVMAILIYAASRLIVRALALIWLMAVSPLAFASHLIPSFSATWSWSGWWKLLIKYAFFAPFLMFLFWAAIKITLGFTPDNKELIKVIADPNASSLMTLINFAIVIGLFYSAIKIADSLSVFTSSSLGGKATKLITAPFRAPAGWLGGAALGLGARGARSALRPAVLTEKQKQRNEYLRIHGNMFQRNMARVRLKADEKARKAQLDPRATKMFQSFQEKTGIKLGKPIETYGQKIKRKASEKVAGQKAEQKYIKEKKIKDEAALTKAVKESGETPQTKSELEGKISTLNTTLGELTTKMDEKKSRLNTLEATGASKKDISKASRDLAQEEEKIKAVTKQINKYKEVLDSHKDDPDNISLSEDTMNELMEYQKEVLKAANPNKYKTPTKTRKAGLFRGSDSRTIVKDLSPGIQFGKIGKAIDELAEKELGKSDLDKIVEGLKSAGTAKTDSEARSQARSILQASEDQ